mmetsp:Transcript_19870/g.41901  ORF Transcript_19870/g.41901 Transcript_19870/m.41901 type:complete len:202 (+) Transcript_19870:1046-1651(+)
MRRNGGRARRRLVRAPPRRIPATIASFRAIFRAIFRASFARESQSSHSPRSARSRASTSASSGAPPPATLLPSSPRSDLSLASVSGSSGASALRFDLRSAFFLAAHAVYGSVHQTGPPSMPSPDTHETQPVVTLGMICPPLCASGTRQMEAVPKLVPDLLMALIEQRISYPGFRHFEMSAASTTFSRTRNSYSSREIACWR